MKLAHKIFIFIIIFLLGAKLLDPDDQLLSIGKKISYGEILFLLYLFAVILKMLCNKSISFLFLSPQQKRFTCFLGFFAAWTAVSWCINTIFLDGDIMDFFGIPVRVLLYCIMSVFFARWVRQYGPNFCAMSYCSGIILMFYYNFTSLFMALGGVPAGVPNNTFSAVLLPASAMFLALAGLASPAGFSLFLMCISFASTVLVYSLSGMLYMFFGLPAVLISMHNFFLNKGIGILKRISMLFFLFLLAITIGYNFNFAFEGISRNIENKINNIPFTEEASGDVQSGEHRFGLIISSLVIAAKNPLVGVGEYNFRAKNMQNKDLIGRIFHDHKNPHNAFAQIISMFGIPAFFLFCMCFYIAFKKLYHLRIKSGPTWKVYVLSSLVVFFATANVMDAIFTTTYFYFYAALIFGIEEWNNHPRMRRYLTGNN